eukprot:TRINITY_DN56720_c0_g1_i1.p1 TRINITY_DN56720_c0_g1~~TRINITY_DN56720_c0_g1_i1.p1  ORF type:complete len:319 (-),score=51.91 TRINITY_DN56720_c0_g1_i1:400-1323(-)
MEACAVIDGLIPATAASESGGGPDGAGAVVTTARLATSGEVVWGPSAVSCDMTVSVIQRHVAKSLGLPIAAVTLLNGLSLLDPKSSLTAAGIINTATLDVVKSDLSQEYTTLEQNLGTEVEEMTPMDEVSHKIMCIAKDCECDALPADICNWLRVLLHVGEERPIDYSEDLSIFTSESLRARPHLQDKVFQYRTNSVKNTLGMREGLSDLRPGALILGYAMSEERYDFDAWYWWWVDITGALGTRGAVWISLINYQHLRDDDRCMGCKPNLQYLLEGLDGARKFLAPSLTSWFCEMGRLRQMMRDLD